MNAPSTVPAGLTDLVARLREVGLSRYEASIYVGLLTDATAKISEISKRTGVPQPKAYQALDSLLDKGFCVVGPDVVNRYRALPPSIALSGYIESLHTAETSANALVGQLSVLQEKGRGRELWAPPFEVIKGSRQVNQLLEERIEAATEEIRVLGKSPAVTDAEWLVALSGALERGLALRFVFERAYLDEIDRPAEALAPFLGLEDVRAAESLPTKLLIFDGRAALTFVTSERGEDFLALLLRDPGLVAHMVASWERSWERGGRPVS